MDYLLDTNIIIQIEKGNAPLAKIVNSINCCIDATVYMECLQGSKSSREKQIVKKALNIFPLIYIDEDVSKTAIDLIDKFSTSHSLYLPDALIAANCLENNFTLLTYNTKDFRFIPSLQIEQPNVISI